MNGARSASTEVAIAPTSSPDETNGFASPPVNADDLARIRTVEPCTTPAMPPPAMRASVHWRYGGMSVTTEADTIVPATTAAGDATTSRAWSSQGMKYAAISTIVAVLNTNKAV